MLFISCCIILIVLVSGGVLCIQDWRTHSVSVFPLLVFILSCFFYYLTRKECSIFLFVVVLCIGLFSKIFLKKNVCGTADYFISISISPFLDNRDLPILLILIGCIGIFASILRKNKIIPFVPAMLISTLVLSVANSLK